MRKLLSTMFGWSKERPEPVHVDHLTGLLRRFAVEQQQVPKDLGELVALRYLKALPEPPDGRKFVIDRKAVEVRLE